MNAATNTEIPARPNYRPGQGLVMKISPTMQRAIVAFSRLNCRQTFTEFTILPFCLPNRHAKSLRRAPDPGRDRADRRPPGIVASLVLQHRPDRPLSY